MYLAHGQDRDDENVGLDDPSRFPLTFRFLLATLEIFEITSLTQVGQMNIHMSSTALINKRSLYCKPFLGTRDGWQVWYL